MIPGTGELFNSFKTADEYYRSLLKENARLREVVRMQTELMEHREWVFLEYVEEYGDVFRCPTCGSETKFSSSQPFNNPNCKTIQIHKNNCKYAEAIRAGKEVLGDAQKNNKDSDNSESVLDDDWHLQWEASEFGD